MSDALLLLLPGVCDPADATACWWHLSADAIVAEGTSAEWRPLASPITGGPGLPLIALVPVASARIDWPEPQGETEKQRLGVARVAALQQGMADVATLHAVAGQVEGRLAVATVSNGSMVEWLDWIAAQGADPIAVLPSGLVAPWSETWVAAALGPERMIARAGLIAPDEPALRDAFVEPAEEVVDLATDALGQRLAWLAQLLPLNLRTGRFARRRLLLLDWRRLRELAALALLVPLLGLVMGLVLLIRLDRDSARLEAETARLASAAVGQQVTAAAAASALDAQIGATPGAAGSPFPPLAALYQQLQQLSGVTAVSVEYRPDGTLAASLAATRVEDINRLLLSLQRLGYRVTATTRPGTSGQMIADLTLRSAE
jgi:general secretion pathway protein L